MVKKIKRGSMESSRVMSNVINTAPTLKESFIQENVGNISNIKIYNTTGGSKKDKIKKIIEK